MAEKGIDGEYTEEIINMLGKGDQKSWSERADCYSMHKAYVCGEPH